MNELKVFFVGKSRNNGGHVILTKYDANKDMLGIEGWIVVVVVATAA